MKNLLPISKLRLGRKFTALFAFALLGTGGTLLASAQEPDLEQRAQQLQTLREDVEQYRKDHHIAGMALAVVKDGEVVLSETFGHARLEPEVAVTQDTRFIIGSSTKSFSSVLTAMLVEEGSVAWDTPVSEIIPEFGLKIDSEDENASATLEDVLSHRSGFPRMSMLWVSPGVQREKVYQAFSKAEPIRPFRQGFNYNNALFTAGADAAASSVGSTWAELVEERIFEPLGMEDTRSTVTVGKQSDQFAFGYTWLEEENRFLRQGVMEGVDNVAPGGAIVSNISDMSKWVQFLLSKGAAGERRLLPESAFEEIWTKRVNITPELGYGIGWFVESWKDRKVVHHGGNIQGYSCQVALMPEENLGLVLLANVTHTPLQSQILPMVFESVLEIKEQESAIAGPSPKIDYTNLVGEYVANFGPFTNTVFTVQDNNGVLAIDVPGQMLYDLNPPKEDGKWYFAITDKIAVSFDGDLNEPVSGIKMYQAGMTFSLPRRTEDFAQSDILSSEALRELMGMAKQRDAFARIGGLEIDAEIRLPNSGLEGTAKILLSCKNDQVRVDMNFGEFGNSETVYAEGVGEIRSSFTDTMEMNTKMTKELLIDQGFVDWFEQFESVSVLKEKTVKGEPLYQVSFSDSDLPQIQALVHQETGRVLRMRTVRTFNPSMPAMPIQISFGDYKEVGGYDLPHSVEIQSAEEGKRIMEFKTVKVVDSFDPELFQMESGS